MKDNAKVGFLEDNSKKPHFPKQLYCLGDGPALTYSQWLSSLYIKGSPPSLESNLFTEVDLRSLTSRGTTLIPIYMGDVRP